MARTSASTLGSRQPGDRRWAGVGRTLRKHDVDAKHELGDIDSPITIAIT
ncbi:MAG TPA: hypothetical protein VEB19_05610 [Gemmatimonadaceae bacterium]|nr:hypothetical protein [Gemmatimonadaceae bacterium]